MLKTPYGGWSEIKIGNWSDRCSYLDDIPWMIYDSLMQVLTTGSKSSVLFDAEGYEYFICFNKDYVSIFTDDDCCITEHINIKTLSEEFVSDIRKDIDKWSRWLPKAWAEDTENSEFIAQEKNELLQYCTDIENLLSVNKN